MDILVDSSFPVTQYAHFKGFDEYCQICFPIINFESICFSTLLPNCAPKVFLSLPVGQAKDIVYLCFNFYFLDYQ